MVWLKKKIHDLCFQVFFTDSCNEYSFIMSDSEDAFILEMRNISKSFGGVHALHDVSFKCTPGTVHALVGENGAGK